MQTISFGDSYHCIVDTEGNVWYCGRNYEYVANKSGRLASFGNVTKPKRMANLRNIRFVHCYDSSSIYLGWDGEVWTCGYNAYGQLGLGDCNNRLQPEQVLNIPKMKLATMGSIHTLMLDESGFVWGCGMNQFNTTDRDYIIKPKMLSFKKFTFVVGGRGCTFLMDKDRKVYLSGNYGKCSNKPGIEEIHLPPELDIEIKHIHVEYMACFIDTNGIVWIVKDIENADGKWVCKLIQVTTVSNIRDMGGDSFGTLFLDNEGAAYFDEGWTSVKIDDTRRIEGLDRK